MKILPLVIAPNPLLKQISKPVEKIDDELRGLMDNMLNTMYAQHGVGLAAVQIGVLKRIVVIDVDYEIEDHEHHHNHDCDGVHVKNTKPRYFVNPEIIEFSKETSSYNEGCLSFPQMRSEICRPKEVKVKFLNYHGQEKIEKMNGLLATCIQHEIDHLDGITFVDHLSRLKREMILNKMKKLKK